jgi:PAS domain S-box-containing protein
VPWGVQDHPDVFRLLFEHHPEPMWIYDLETLRFLDVNSAAVEQYGYSREEFENMSIAQIRPSEELERLARDLAEPRPDLQHSGVWRHCRRDGSLIQVEITSHRLRYADKAAALVIARDVSQRVEADRRRDQLLRETETARRELEVQTRNFDVMFEQMADPVMLFDAHGRVERMNEAARAIFAGNTRVAPGSVSSAELAERFRLRDENGAPIPQDNLPVMRVLRGELLSGATAFDGQVGSRGHPVFLSITGSAIRDRDGEVIGAVMVSRDVTERRMLEHQAQTALRELNQRMEAFLSIAAHEMRTPLTSILGNIQLAARSLEEMDSAPIDAPVPVQELKALVLRMERQGRLLNRLVNDVLDASTMDTSRIKLNRSRFDMRKVVEAVVTEAQSHMRGRTIETQLEAERPPVVDGDRERIGQVLSRFLANAHKFSPLEKPVHVGLDCLDSLVEVWVADHGPGVPAAEREHVWERFYRVEGLSHVSGSSVGLGLGLYLGRRIVERHGGSVGLEAPASGGARFWFRLPLAPTPSEMPPSGAATGTGDFAKR